MESGPPPNSLSPVRRGIVEALYFGARLRSLTAPLISESVLRRAFPHVLLRGYVDFTQHSTIPPANFAPDFELYQAAEVLGTVGTFHGPGALDQVIAELHDAFDEVRFVPKAVRKVDDHRLVLIVRFGARGRGSGVRVDQSIAHVWTREGVLARRLEVYWEPREAYEAVRAATG